jgi:hypothetical protein
MSGSSSGSTCRLRLLAAAVAAALAVACGASAIPQPSEADARWASTRWPGTTQKELADGRALYVRKCGGCHTLWEPQVVVDRGWPANFLEMARRAKLSAGDRERVRRYLSAVGRRE